MAVSIKQLADTLYIIKMISRKVDKTQLLSRHHACACLFRAVGTFKIRPKTHFGIGKFISRNLNFFLNPNDYTKYIYNFPPYQKLQSIYFQLVQFVSKKFAQTVPTNRILHQIFREKKNWLKTNNL